MRVHPGRLHWSSGRSFQTLPFSCITGIIAPSTSRLLQTLPTGPQSRAVLSCISDSIKITQSFGFFLNQLHCISTSAQDVVPIKISPFHRLLPFPKSVSKNASIICLEPNYDFERQVNERCYQKRL